MESDLKRQLFEESDENERLRQQLQELRSAASSASHLKRRVQQLEQETKEQAARLRECQEQLVVSSSQKGQLGRAEALCKRYKERLDAMKERCADMEVIECAVPNRRVCRRRWSDSARWRRRRSRGRRTMPICKQS